MKHGQGTYIPYDATTLNEFTEVALFTASVGPHEPALLQANSEGTTEPGGAIANLPTADSFPYQGTVLEGEFERGIDAVDHAVRPHRQELAHANRRQPPHATAGRVALAATGAIVRPRNLQSVAIAHNAALTGWVLQSRPPCSRCAGRTGWASPGICAHLQSDPSGGVRFPGTRE